jgi:hypothetical protein
MASALLLKSTMVIGSGVPACLLKHLFKKLTNDCTTENNKEIEECVLQYCLAQGDDCLWPDLQAAVNGNGEKCVKFYKIAEEIIEEISGASPYRHGSKRVL